jgi:SMP-30/Gluconolactonase/LRE-like region
MTIRLFGIYLHGIGGAVLVGVFFSWWSAAGLLSACLLCRRILRRGLLEYLWIWRAPEQMRLQRRASYDQWLGVEPPNAKEARIFGLTDWLVARFWQDWDQCMREPARIHRRLFRNLGVAYGALGLAYALVFVRMADAAAEGALELGALALVVQASSMSLTCPAVVHGTTTSNSARSSFPRSGRSRPTRSAPTRRLAGHLSRRAFHWTPYDSSRLPFAIGAATTTSCETWTSRFPPGARSRSSAPTARGRRRSSSSWPVCTNRRRDGSSWTASTCVRSILTSGKGGSPSFPGLRALRVARSGERRVRLCPEHRRRPGARQSGGEVRFDIEPESGNVSNRRHLVELPKAWGLPDGMTVDGEGSLWVAFWTGSAVRRLSPDGRVTSVVGFPVSQVTSCAF